MFVEEIRDEDMAEDASFALDHAPGPYEHPWKSINDCILTIGTTRLRPTPNASDAKILEVERKKSMTLLEAEFIGKAALLHDKHCEALQKHIEMKREVDTDAVRVAVRGELREYFRKRVISIPNSTRSTDNHGMEETKQAILKAVKMQEAKLEPVEYEGFVVVRKPDFV